MEYLAYIAVIVVVIVCIFAYGKLEEKRSRAWFYKKRMQLFGQPSKKIYEDNRFQTLKQSVEYHLKTDDKDGQAPFCVDDITWNDLDMDRVFRCMDYTVSSSGEDALYRYLRFPAMDEESLLSRKKHMEYLAGHKEDCVRYQTLMSRVGKTGKYTVYQYLDFLDAVEGSSCIADWIADIGILVFLVLGIFVKTIFILPAVFLMFYNGYTYFIKKNKIEPYFESLSCFVRTLKAVDGMQNMPRPFQKEFYAEYSRILDLKKQFDAFRRGSSLALENTASTGAGDLSQLLMSYFKMIFHFDFIKFYSMLHIVKEKKHEMIALIELSGEMEAQISMVYFREHLPCYIIPEFWNEKDQKRYTATQMYHPLIADPVKNDVDQKSCMLLTGSNASGKSTFLKMVALNALLAQSICTVCADFYQAAFYRIYSSMALRDSLSEGDSYFIVEIKSMKRIFDAVKASDIPVLCTIDEVLRGTNTAERIGASTELLKALSKQGVLCFAATHDMELTTYLKDVYDNYHFEEMVDGDQISFPYRLVNGPSRGRNAIRLLEAFGFDREITDNAHRLAEKLTGEQT